MNRNNKLFTFLSILILMSMLLSACGGVSSEPTKGPPDEDQSSEEAQPEEAQPEEVQEPEISDKYGGTLRHAIHPPANLDPAFLGSIADDEIARQWHDFLVFIGEDNQPDIDRSIAEKWEVSEDGRQWTFTLRKGILFHNGKEMTSEDVKLSFERLRDPELGSPSVDLYTNVLSIDAPDDYTVVFKLRNPSPDFLKDLGDLHGLVVDADTKDFNTEFNGTGPFMIESYIPEDRLVFKRNPNYWQKDEDGNQLPYLDGMEFIFLSDNTAQVEALRGGQIDWIIYLPPEYVEVLEQDPNTVVYRQPSNTLWLLHMRSDREPANDNRVRQALKLATDRQAILEATYQGLGYAGHDSPIGPAYGDFFLDEPLPPRDVEKAKDLLADAGYADGLEIEIVCQDRSPVPAMCTVWKEQLAEAGVTVNIQIVPTDVYYGAENVWMEADFAITDWGSRSYPQPYLDLAFKCGANWNESHWCDEEHDRLAELAAMEMDHEKRTEYYHQIQELFMERGPIILVFFVDNLYGASARLKGVHPPMAFGTGTDLRRVYIEE